MFEHEEKLLNLPMQKFVFSSCENKKPAMVFKAIHSAFYFIKPCKMVDVRVLYEAKYPRMDQVKFVESAFKRFVLIWSVLTDHIISSLLKTVFHKFNLVHS